MRRSIPCRGRKLRSLAKDTEIMSLDGADLLASSRTLQHAAWRLVALDDLAPARTTARYAAMTASLAMAVLVLIAVALWQRRRAIRHKLASQAALQAAHDSLESMVVARTAELRAAQSDLVHAGKMGVARPDVGRHGARAEPAARRRCAPCPTAPASCSTTTASTRRESISSASPAWSTGWRG